MTEREIKELRVKIGTDPILSIEEIEYIWEAIDRYVEKLDEYCWFCGKKLDCDN